MRLSPMLTAVLLAQLAAVPSEARTPPACHRCRAVCGDAIAECLAASTCPAAPRGKAHRCMVRARRHCRKVTTAHCITTCKRTGSPACASTPAPGACAAFTSTCTAVAMTPVQTTNAFSDQQSMAFNAHTAPPGPAGCCVIDGCAGVTRSDATGGNVSVDYLEIVYLRNGAPYNGTITTKVGVSCPIGIPTDVYSRSDIYRVNFTPDLPFSLPPGPPAWSAPYVVSAGDLSLSIDSADVPHPTDVQNSFTPSTWRLVGQTLGIDKVCAEQQLMQGHATASFIKNDGTPCTVTIYAQGTRAVAPQ